MELIAAVSKNGVIGANGELPWHIPEDLRRFKELTTGSVIVMGRPTYFSLPKRPLPDRLHLVITTTPERYDEGPNVRFIRLSDLYEFLPADRKVFIIGGGLIYSYFIRKCNVLHITVVNQEYAGDTYFPEIPTDLFELAEVCEGEGPYRFEKWIRKNED